MLQKKICLLGSVAVGKTSLVRRLVEGVFSERYLTTIGVKIDRKRLEIGGRRLTLLLWDLAGEDEFAQLESKYLRGSAGYILVVDATRSETLGHAKELRARVESCIGPVPFVVALNKMDLEEAQTLQWRGLSDLLAAHPEVMKTSAKTGQGVEALFQTLGERLLHPDPARTRKAS